MKMNVIYFGVDKICALFMRHQSKTRNRYAKISLLFTLSNSVFTRISYASRLMVFLLQRLYIYLKVICFGVGVLVVVGVGEGGSSSM